MQRSRGALVLATLLLLAAGGALGYVRGKSADLDAARALEVSNPPLAAAIEQQLGAKAALTDTEIVWARQLMLSDPQAALLLLQSSGASDTAALGLRNHAAYLAALAAQARKKPVVALCLLSLFEPATADSRDVAAVQSIFVTVFRQAVAAEQNQGHDLEALALVNANGNPLAQEAAAQLKPDAELAVVRELEDDLNYSAAATAAQALAGEFPGTAAGKSAEAMLRQPQSVSGTLVTAAGSAIAVEFRLTANFHLEPGTYFSSPPFYYGKADSNGDLTVNAIPVGGPYLMEVKRGDQWQTLIDPQTGKLASPVTVEAMRPSDLGFIVVPS